MSESTFRSIFTIIPSGLIAWLWATLLVGRTVPWQANRVWAFGFSIVFAVSCIWWWRHATSVCRLTGSPRTRLTVLSWSLVPLAGLVFILMVPAYLSDGFYGFLVWPGWRGEVLAAVALATICIGTAQSVSLVWFGSRCSGSLACLGDAISERAGFVAWTCLIVVGIVEGAASTSPIGDDIGKYVEAACALLAGTSYPVHQAAPYLVAAGMTADSPALPGLPILIAISFAVFGQTTFGLSLPLAALAAVFPPALFAACKALTGSRSTAYTTAILLTLFPAYQFHILGSPVPDTLFVVLLSLVAALAARAGGRGELAAWIGVGAVSGFVADARPEGLTFSVATMGYLLLFHWRKKQYWLAVAAYLAVLAPYSLVYLSTTGSFWPTTFGGTIGLQHLGSNLGLIHDLVVPWYAQAIGLPPLGLFVLGVVAIIGLAFGSLALWRSRPDMLFVPLLGAGYIGSSLLIHPLILMSYTPVDSLRHWSSGVPFVVLTLAYAAYSASRNLSRRLRGSMRTVSAIALLLLLSGIVFYESDRLAKPEFYFGGKASLLWTGSPYLLTDLAQRSFLLPPGDDPRPWETVREEMRATLSDVDLRRVNRAEPYHWVSMMFALFGLLYLTVPLVKPISDPPAEREVT